MTSCTNPKPVDFGLADIGTFKVCAFLVNVLSHMFDQWTGVGSPAPGKFNWVPVNACTITSNFNVADYDFGELIWSEFSYQPKPGVEVTVIEPFASIVKSKVDNNLYLVFRGTKSAADESIDTEIGRVSYSPPTPNPPSDIQVVNGFYKVYNGLLNNLGAVDGLRAQLKKIGGAGQKLTITGHSLGGALATLAIPEGVANDLTVRQYNSASPMVGIDKFRTYYDSLKQSSPGSLRETFRLVNGSDIVPKLPGFPYVHVGTLVSFNANYGIEKSTHNPCCSYAYAIYNPNDPCNQRFDACNVPPN